MVWRVDNFACLTQSCDLWAAKIWQSIVNICEILSGIFGI